MLDHEAHGRIDGLIVRMMPVARGAVEEHVDAAACRLGLAEVAGYDRRSWRCRGIRGS
ncbi:hypothetical protein FHR81_003030 [Actinoalloteichus hoggarensis]|uniref:hypothetical protein n=1 Tax=Actinoalloteichus hoggarensis TaxID=1470176 RepID=UPI0012FD615D|nr:hypothetical protein [Actinoalloteichus hoggarensis]MBB5921990.1 hypothetical protein [Actinoalloteichus hoggarensis]